MRVLILGLLCTLYVMGQNPDPVMSVGGGGGGGGGAGTVTSVTGGVGIQVVNGTTTPEVSKDTAETPTWSAGTGAPSANCTAGSETYTDTSAGAFYTCGPTNNTWKLYASPAMSEVVVQALVTADFTTATTTGDGKFYFVVPQKANGMNLVNARAQVITAGTTNTTDVQIARCAVTTSGNACSGTVSDMLSTKITIDSGENSSDSAATAAVINTSNDDVATGQVIRIDVDAISSTPAQGLMVILTFRLP